MSELAGEREQFREQREAARANTNVTATFSSFVLNF